MVSNYDLISARAMLKAKRFLYVGFLCHQVVEKCLKAYFWHTRRQEPPRTHNLNVLSVESGFDADSKRQYQKLCDKLSPLNIECRYPEEKAELLKSLNVVKCQKLLKETKELYRWIKKLLL